VSDRENGHLSRFVIHPIDDPVVPDPHAPLFLLSRPARLDGAPRSQIFGEVTYGSGNKLVNTFGKPDQAFRAFRLKTTS